MNILIVLSYYSPYVSGVTEFARMLAEDLAKRHQVTVLACRHDDDLPLEEVINGVRVVRAPVFARLHKGALSWQLFSLFRRLGATADVVNVHLPMLEAGLLSFMVPKSKLIANYQCDMAYAEGVVDWFAVTVARASCWIATLRAKYVAVTTMDYARTSKWIGGTPTKQREVFAPMKPIAVRQVKRDSKGTEYVFGFLGRFVEEKGLPILLDAFSGLVSAHPNGIKLVLAGDHSSVAGGSVLNKIQASIFALGGSVEVWGRLDEDRLEEFYATIDTLVLPSVNRYEAFGMVQLEAMLAGATVIASDLPGVRTIVRRTGNGLIVPVGNPRALENAMEEILNSDQWGPRSEIISRATAAYPSQLFYQLQEQLFIDDGNDSRFN